jgi:hypothetical protein
MKTKDNIGVINPARFGDLFYRVSRSRNLHLHGRKKKFIEFVVIFIG